MSKTGLGQVGYWLYVAPIPRGKYIPWEPVSAEKNRCIFSKEGLWLQNLQFLQ